MTDIGFQSGADRLWTGFSADRALAWTRVLRMHWPTWPGATALWTITTGLQEGRPADLADWVQRARDAEQVGFTPQQYDRLHRALDAIPAVDHPAHPDNEPDPRWPVHAIRVFDPAAWADWPWLVGAGWDDEEAATLLLTAQDLLH